MLVQVQFRKYFEVLYCLSGFIVFYFVSVYSGSVILLVFQTPISNIKNYFFSSKSNFLPPSLIRYQILLYLFFESHDQIRDYRRWVDKLFYLPEFTDLRLWFPFFLPGFIRLLGILHLWPFVSQIHFYTSIASGPVHCYQSWLSVAYQTVQISWVLWVCFVLFCFSLFLALLLAVPIVDLAYCPNVCLCSIWCS